jgi:ribonuclease J
MEGTNLGSSKRCISEDELEKRYIDLFKSTAGRVFVAWSAQNVDRTATLFKACAKKDVGRTLVVDLYTAEVMEMLAQFGRLPHPSWGHIRVVVTRGLARMYEKTGREDFVKRMLPYGISARALVEDPSNWVVMTRKSLLRDFEKSGVLPTPADAWSWSLWRGYLDEGDGVMLREWFESRNCPACHIHTSGHASPGDLREFASCINAKLLIPVHGVAWDEERVGFSNILRLADGKPVNLRQHLSARIAAAQPTWECAPKLVLRIFSIDAPRSLSVSGLRRTNAGGAYWRSRLGFAAHRARHGPGKFSTGCRTTGSSSSRCAAVRRRRLLWAPR